MRPMGITRIADVTGLDRIGVPVTTVCRPNSRSLSVSQGKGTTLDAARASGLMEAVELYHAERVDLPLKYASYEELRYEHTVVDPTALPSTAYARFRAGLRTLWAEGFDVLNEESVWLPLEVVSTDYTLPRPPGSGCFAATSNGLASGNSLAEAMSHGICEVIERDATTLWHLLGPSARAEARLDLDSVSDPGCRRIVELCERAETILAVWVVTSDAGVPVFEAVIIDREDDPWHRLHAAAGMGCHPVREVALVRAMTEAIQSRLTVITGSRDDLFRVDYARARNRDRQEEVRELLADDRRAVSMDVVPTWEAETLEEDVVWELERLRSMGVQRVIVANLTRPEFEIPVVRVVVPGLEGVDHVPGFVPGERARRVLGEGP